MRLVLPLPRRFAARRRRGSFFAGDGDEDLVSTKVDQANDPVGAVSVQEELLAEVKSMRAEIAEMRRSAGGQSS